MKMFDQFEKVLKVNMDKQNGLKQSNASAANSMTSGKSRPNDTSKRSINSIIDLEKIMETAGKYQD